MSNYPPNPPPSPFQQPNPYQPSGIPDPSRFPYQPQPKNNLALAAAITGGVSILAGLCCPLIGFPVSIAGIVMGAMSLKPPNKTLALVGIICGVLGLIVTIANAAAGVWLQMQMDKGQNPFAP